MRVVCSIPKRVVPALAHALTALDCASRNKGTGSPSLCVTELVPSTVLGKHRWDQQARMSASLPFLIVLGVAHLVLGQ